MGLKRQRHWGCTGNNTAGVFTVKKNVIISQPRHETRKKKKPTAEMLKRQEKIGI